MVVILVSPVPRSPWTIAASFRSFLWRIGFAVACLLEQRGFEPSVSREVFPKKNTRACWDISDRSRLASFENEFAFSSGQVQSLTLNSGVARMRQGRRWRSCSFPSSCHFWSQNFCVRTSRVLFENVKVLGGCAGKGPNRNIDRNSSAGIAKALNAAVSASDTGAPR